MNENHNLESATAINPRIKATATIIDKIRSSQDLATIFQAITKEIRQVLNCDRLIVYQFNSDWSGMVVAESVEGNWISMLTKQQDFNLSPRLYNSPACSLQNWSKTERLKPDTYLQKTQGGKYLDREKYTVVNNIYSQGFPDCYIQSLEKYQARAYIIVPIFQDENLWGLLGAYQNNDIRVWQQEDIDLMVQASNQLAIGIQQAEYINQLKLQTRNLEITVQELKLAQQQLIQQEKLAALGQLVAGIAHEINTPLGAIKASAGNIDKALIDAIAELPKLSQYLNETEQDVFFNLLDRGIMSKPLFSSSEKRPLKRKITSILKAHQIDNSRSIADMLIDIGVYEEIESYLILIGHQKVDWILELAYNLSRLLGNNQTILASVEKASKVVFALKNYAHFDAKEEQRLIDVTQGIDTVLEIYHNRIKYNIELYRDYHEIPEIWCYPDELVQVWTNLIHNAVQAMKDGGKLSISTAVENDGIAITIEDSGTGIDPAIRDRIFEPFFTTKPVGEGSGLGLHITRKIVEKHQGNIAILSKPGQTIFKIWLPKNK
ncbi:MAG: ATP-binding protein [Cyanobacteria bacterium P01_G01_bin.19]